MKLNFLIAFDHPDAFDKPHYGPMAQGGTPVSLLPSLADFAIAHGFHSWERVAANHLAHLFVIPTQFGWRLVDGPALHRAKGRIES